MTVISVAWLMPAKPEAASLYIRRAGWHNASPQHSGFVGPSQHFFPLPLWSQLFGAGNNCVAESTLAETWEVRTAFYLSPGLL